MIFLLFKSCYSWYLHCFPTSGLNIQTEDRQCPPAPQSSVKPPVRAWCTWTDLNQSIAMQKKKKKKRERDKFNTVNICCDRLQMLFCVVSVLLFFGLAAGETFERLPSAQPDEQKGPCLLFLIHKGLPLRRAGVTVAPPLSGLVPECVPAPFFPECSSVSLKPLVALPLYRGVLPLSVVKCKQEETRYECWQRERKCVSVCLCVHVSLLCVCVVGAEAQTLGVLCVRADAASELPPESQRSKPIRNHVAGRQRVSGDCPNCLLWRPLPDPAADQSMCHQYIRQSSSSGDQGVKSGQVWHFIQPTN